MTDAQIYKIAREHLNASGKPPDLDDIQSLPSAFDRYRESHHVGRTERQFRTYLRDVRGWSFDTRRVTYNPDKKRRLPRLTTEQLVTHAKGYLTSKEQDPTDDECLGAVRSFDYWREYEGRDGHLRPIPRKPRPHGRNQDRFDRFLEWVLFWTKKPPVPICRQVALFDGDLQ